MGTFVDEWVRGQRRALAESLLSDSAEAKVLARVLDQLEHDHDTYQNEELPTAKAAEESGYTPQQIRMLRRARKISTRRKDLPRKPGHGVARGPQALALSETPSIADRVLHGRRRTG